MNGPIEPTSHDGLDASSRQPSSCSHVAAWSCMAAPHGIMGARLFSRVVSIGIVAAPPCAVKLAELPDACLDIEWAVCHLPQCIVPVEGPWAAQRVEHLVRPSRYRQRE